MEIIFIVKLKKYIANICIFDIIISKLNLKKVMLNYFS